MRSPSLVLISLGFSSEVGKCSIQSGTYQNSPYVGVPPSPSGGTIQGCKRKFVQDIRILLYVNYTTVTIL